MVVGAACFCNSAKETLATPSQHPHYAPGEIMTIDRRFMPDVIDRILSKMPGTVEELAVSADLHSSTVSRYIRMMYPSMCHVCGHKGNNPERVTSNPAKVYGSGAGADTVYVPVNDSVDYREQRKEYMMKRRARLKQERGDPDYDRLLVNMRIKATKNVSKALTKQNTPFGPLFDLQEKK